MWYWKFWQEGNFQSGCFEAEDRETARCIAAEASGYAWQVEWQSEGCSIYAAERVDWLSEPGAGILFLYQKKE